MSLVGVLSNPMSTRNTSGLGLVRDVVEDFNGVFHFEIGDIRDVSLALHRFAEYGTEVIAINGGDGTIHAVFSILINEKPFKKMPLIAILPAGKTNMISEDLGAKQPRPHHYLRRLLEWAKDGSLNRHVVKRHVLKVEGIDRQQPIYGMFLGTAGIIEGIAYTRRRIHPLGLPNALSHALSMAVLFCRAIVGGFFRKGQDERSLVQVTIDRKGTVMGRYLVVIATTLNRLLLGFRAGGGEGAGAVRYFSVEDTPGIIMRAIWLALTGKLGKRAVAGVTNRDASLVRLRLTTPITVDGEFYTPLPGREVIISAEDNFTFVNFGNPEGAS